MSICYMLIYLDHLGLTVSWNNDNFCGQCRKSQKKSIVNIRKLSNQILYPRWLIGESTDSPVVALLAARRKSLYEQRFHAFCNMKEAKLFRAKIK